MFAIFADRRDAGRKLAEKVALRHFTDPVVLALPRGGVPVAVEVAEAIHAPLDLILVRKLGAPREPELAIGAVVDGPSPHIVLNDDIVREVGATPGDIDAIATRELAVIAGRRRLWLADRPAVGLAGRTAIIVDDGIATGATVKAAVVGARRQGAARVVIATPLAPAETVASLAALADEFVVVSTPHPFRSIGRFYDDFTQLTDADVAALLRRHGEPPAAA